MAEIPNNLENEKNDFHFHITEEYAEIDVHVPSEPSGGNKQKSEYTIIKLQCGDIVIVPVSWIVAKNSYPSCYYPTEDELKSCNLAYMVSQNISHSVDWECYPVNILHYTDSYKKACVMCIAAQQRVYKVEVQDQLEDTTSKVNTDKDSESSSKYTWNKDAESSAESAGDVAAKSNQEIRKKKDINCSDNDMMLEVDREQGDIRIRLGSELYSFIQLVADLQQKEERRPSHSKYLLQCSLCPPMPGYRHLTRHLKNFHQMSPSAANFIASLPKLLKHNTYYYLCSVCYKFVKNLQSHWRNYHSDIDFAVVRSSAVQVSTRGLVSHIRSEDTRLQFIVLDSRVEKELEEFVSYRMGRNIAFKNVKQSIQDIEYCLKYLQHCGLKLYDINDLSEIYTLSDILFSFVSFVETNRQIRSVIHILSSFRVFLCRFLSLYHTDLLNPFQEMMRTFTQFLSNRSWFKETNPHNTEGESDVETVYNVLSSENFRSAVQDLHTCCNGELRVLELKRLYVVLVSVIGVYFSLLNYQCPYAIMQMKIREYNKKTPCSGQLLHTVDVRVKDRYLTTASVRIYLSGELITLIDLFLNLFRPLYAGRDVSTINEKAVLVNVRGESYSESTYLLNIEKLWSQSSSPDKWFNFTVLKALGVTLMQQYFPPLHGKMQDYAEDATSALESPEMTPHTTLNKSSSHLTSSCMDIQDSVGFAACKSERNSTQNLVGPKVLKSRRKNRKPTHCNIQDCCGGLKSSKLGRKCTHNSFRSATVTRGELGRKLPNSNVQDIVGTSRKRGRPRKKPIYNTTKELASTASGRGKIAPNSSQASEA